MNHGRICGHANKATCNCCLLLSILCPGRDTDLMFNVNDTLLFKFKLVTRSVDVAIAWAHLHQIV